MTADCAELWDAFWAEFDAREAGRAQGESTRRRKNGWGCPQEGRVPLENWSWHPAPDVPRPGPGHPPPPSGTLPRPDGASSQWGAEEPGMGRALGRRAPPLPPPREGVGENAQLNPQVERFLRFVVEAAVASLVREPEAAWLRTGRDRGGREGNGR